MAMQQSQNSGFARKLGAKLSAANEQAKDKPLDLGNRRLPPGIRGGVAKLTACYTKEQDKEDGMVPRGEVFFRAAADVVWPKEHDGESLEGASTQQLIPLCDVPAKGNRKERAFLANYFDFQNLLRLLGIPACPETVQTDPTGTRTEAYWFSAMAALTNPRNPPVYISFSTRGWKSAKRPEETPEQYAKREPMCFEDWHGLATKEEVAKATAGWTPGGGVVEGPPRAALPAPAPQAPPTQHAPAGSGRQATVTTLAAPAPTTQLASTPPPVAAPTSNGSAEAVSEPGSEGESNDATDDVEWLVATALEDPDGATPEGADATARLEEMAWAQGWSRDDTSSAADWSVVGEMAVRPPSSPTGGPVAVAPSPTPEPESNGAPEVGSRWLFRRRNKEGEPLKDRKQQPFAPQEVEVTALDAATRTCTVSTADGKAVLDLRSKKPVDVKYEWLEPIGY